MQIYKLNEAEDFTFLQVPKVLNTNKCYRCKLTSDAKLIYSLLLDRMHLSKLNGWHNENNEIYLIYTKQNIAEILGISERTVYYAFKELSECELIDQKQQGLNLPNLIYIGHANTDYKRICKICSPRHAEYAGQEMQKLQGNNTEVSNTEVMIKRINVVDAKAYDVTFYKFLFKYFFTRYKEHTGKEHPVIKQAYIVKVMDNIENFCTDYNVTKYDDWKKIIDLYFKTDLDCDRNIIHFSEYEVIYNRASNLHLVDAC
jgi:DNA-binding transcriptional ArsR family regulator